MNPLSRTEVEKAEDLCVQINDALAESEEAIEVVIDSFCRLSQSIFELATIGGLTDIGVQRADQILSEVPVIVTALQFQDRLKQRLDHVTETLHQVSRRRDEESYVNQRAEDAMSRFGAKVSHKPAEDDEDNIVLFVDAA